jgi:beta-galactosidase/beta-glucuronidase
LAEEKICFVLKAITKFNQLLFTQYVLDEANIKSHGLWAIDGIVPGTLPEWRPLHFDRVTRMVERDKNHPSIIAWSMGNEAADGPVFDEISDWLHERDPSRVVIYEGSALGTSILPVSEHSDIEARMYLTAATCDISLVRFRILLKIVLRE